MSHVENIVHFILTGRHIEGIVPHREALGPHREVKSVSQGGKSATINSMNTVHVLLPPTRKQKSN